jgi:hypothetical protein
MGNSFLCDKWYKRTCVHRSLTTLSCRRIKYSAWHLFWKDLSVIGFWQYFFFFVYKVIQINFIPHNWCLFIHNIVHSKQKHSAFISISIILHVYHFILLHITVSSLSIMLHISNFLATENVLILLCFEVRKHCGLLPMPENVAIHFSFFFMLLTIHIFMCM